MKHTFSIIITLYLLSVSFTVFGKEYSINKGVSFRENKGQLTDQNQQLRNDVLFYGNTNGMGYFLKKNGISYQLYKVYTSDIKHDTHSLNKTSIEIDAVNIFRVDIEWVGSNNKLSVSHNAAEKDFDNYYNCAAPVLGVRSFQNIVYNNIYNKIDLKYYSKNGSLKYDYILRPGADYKNILLKYKGAESLKLNEDGSVTIKTPLGNINEAAPEVIQEGRKIEASWIIKNNSLSFEIGNYDKTKTLIIDPMILQWGTYYGGNAYDIGSGVSTDTLGNVYMVGRSSSATNIATSGAYQTTVSGNDGFIVKFDNSGNRIWGTYYGGIGDDYFYGCANYSNSVFVCGTTTSNTNIATTGAFLTNYPNNPSGYNGFLVKFDNNGLRQWSTYINGLSNNCATDNSGNVFICGTTNIFTGVATSGTFQSTKPASSTYASCFIEKFDTNGLIKWGSYFGGTGSVNASFNSCSKASNGGVYAVGNVNYGSNNLATPNAFQTSYSGTLSSSNNGIIVKFDSTGNRSWSTYFGVADNTIYSCASNNNDLYIVGRNYYTTAPFATTGAFQTTFGGGNIDGNVAKFDSSGARQWCTFYGGSADDWITSCALSNNNHLFVFGATTSSNNIASIGAYSPTLTMGTFTGQPYYEPFFGEFDANGQQLYGSYYGNYSVFVGDGAARSCAVDLNENLFFCGTTNQTSNYATSGSFQPTYGSGTSDAYLVKFATSCIAPATPIITASSTNICQGDSVLLTATIIPNVNYSWYKNGVAISGANSNTYSANVTGNYIVSVTNATNCNSQSTGITLTSSASPVISISSINAPCTGAPLGSINVTVSGGTPPYSFTWSNTSTNTPTDSNLSLGVYTVITKDSLNCGRTDTVTIIQDTTTLFSQPIVEICAVTVDSASGKNLVVYEKNGLVRATHYNIYRETSASGQYALLGSLLPNQFSTLLDTSSLPDQQSYSYKISEIDSCNNESPLSNFHKTIHLTSNVGINNEVNLIWNQYEGKPYPTNYIMRSVNGGTFVNIAQVASTTLSYTDLTPPTGAKHYRIDIDLPTTCNPTAKLTSFDRINSNTVDIVSIGIDNIPTSNIQIIPNPTSGIINIIGTTPTKIKIMDALGRLVMSEENKTQLSMESLATGVYLVNLYDKNGLIYYHQKIVKQ